ncbi:30S ribosomal protein S5 [Candidatus Berkelbacteria bacterium]|nr:30S ribosomal protein S5 [Candidatus Berkelbacteria bacterium]
MAKESQPREKEKKEFEERVIEIDRVSRTVKGGKRMRFRALVVIGNRKGKVGMGLGKAGDVQSAVKKAVKVAKRDLIEVPIVNDTIPHEVTVKFGGAQVFLKPAAAGTSIIAGGAVRAVIELAGIRNILSKIIGSSNKINNVRATIKTLDEMSVVKAKSKAKVKKADTPEKSVKDDKKDREKAKK